MQDLYIVLTGHLCVGDNTQRLHISPQCNFVSVLLNEYKTEELISCRTTHDILINCNLLLRTLNNFEVSKHTLEIVYKNLVVYMWYGNLNVKQ